VGVGVNETAKRIEFGFGERIHADHDVLWGTSTNVSLMLIRGRERVPQP
jgi:hypothetical protein